MVGFVGIALAAFVIGDAIQNGNTWFSANQRVALAIDGDKVNIEDYGQRLNALTEQMQQQQGQLSDEQRMNINNIPKYSGSVEEVARADCYKPFATKA